MRKAVLILVALALSIASSASPQQAEALTPSTSPDKVTVGEWLTYTVDVPLAEGETIAGPGPEADFGSWEVRGYDVQPSTGQAIVTYNLAAFETGEVEVPSIELTVTGPQGNARTVSTASVKVTVESVLQGEEDTAPADIVGPLTLPEKPLAILVRVLLVAVIVALIALGAWLLWRRRKQRMAEEKRRSDPPDVVALKALRALKAAQLAEEGRIKQYYSELSEIARTYICARYGIRTLEETTSHIVAALQADKSTSEHAPAFEDLLREADLVKFAKSRPDMTACRSALDGMERLVRETAPPAVSSEE